MKPTRVRAPLSSASGAKPRLTSEIAPIDRPAAAGYRRVLRSRSCVRRVAVAALALLAFLLIPGRARAGDTVITFEDLGAGKVVSNQYVSRGVELITSVAPTAATAQLPTVRSVAPGKAQSGSRIADAWACGHDFCRPTILGRFVLPRHVVRVHVGVPAESADVNVVLAAYDGSGASLVTQVKSVKPTTGYHTELSVSTAGQKIVFFQVYAARDGAVLGIDDLSFDATTKASPDFALFPATAYTGLNLHKGGSVSTVVNINRFGGSTGPIAFSAVGLPPGVGAAFKPTPAAIATNQVTMTLSASAGAAAAYEKPLTLVAKPVPTAGPVERTLKYSLSLDPGFDAQVNGIEVTQAIQTVGLPQRDAAKPNDSVPYTGVKLAEGRKTVARVYANLKVGAPGSETVRASAVLYGFRADGTKLLPSPLLADDGTRELKVGPALVFGTGERYAADGAFTFTLPPSWTSGAISLRAVVYPFSPGLSFTTECASCRDNNTFILSGISFTHLKDVDVNTISMSVRGASGKLIMMPDPEFVFRRVRKVFPLADAQLRFAPYLGAIDITDIANDTTLDGDGMNNAAFQRLKDWEKGDDRGPNFTIGVNTGVARGKEGQVVYCDSFLVFKYGCSADIPIAVVEYTRPLTSVGHEFVHGFYRPHAGPNCPKVTGAEDWPPDQKGFLQGIGLDTTAGSGGILGPYQVIADGAPSEPAQWYDLMSYCADAATDTDSWISPHNWDAILDFDVNAVRGGGSAPPAAIPVGPALAVDASVGPTGTRILAVGPSSDGVPANLQPSPYHLLALDSGNNILAATEMFASENHSDPGGTAIYLQGQVPDAGATAVEIVVGGTVIARRERSPSRPVVTLVAPKRRAHIAAVGTTRLRWDAGDPDGQSLLASVDYSASAGAGWHTIFIGPARDGVDLPTSFFSRSSKARLRVRVNDGFDEAVAVAGPFSAAGHVPVVRILSPVSGARVAAGASLYLGGNAYDSAGKPLRGKSLRWFSGRRLLGNGQALSTSALHPGPQLVRLEAKDAAGRAGTAAVRVDVSTAPPQFVLVDVPQHVPAAAGRIALRVSATVPSTLTIDFHVFSVDRTVKRLVLPIRPGRRPLELQLHLRSTGGATGTTVTIPRQ